MQGITITLLLLCLLGVTYQAQTFSPIHPGSIHVDQFSTLDNDRVNVPDFTVANFGAAVLDFKSLKSATPVEVDLAGGINVQGDDLQFFSTGDSTIGTQVNDMSVNALLGQVLLQSNNGDADFEAFAGDLTIDSANSDINIRSPNGEIYFESSAFLLNGRQNSHGLSLTTENSGDITISAGVVTSEEEPLTSLVNIAAYSISFDLQSTVSLATQSGDATLSAGDGIQMSSSTFEINAQEGISTTSDASSIFFESEGLFRIGANELQILSSNSQAYSSVTGDISVGSSATSDYQALDTIEINSVNNGINVNAQNDITATAGNNVLFNSEGPMNVLSRTFTISSEKDKFVIDTNGDTSIDSLQATSITTTLDTKITAADEVFVQGTNGVTYTIQMDATLNSDDVLGINAGQDAIFNSRNLYFDALEEYSFYGNSLDISADSSVIKFESGLDVQITAKDDVKFSYNDDGYIIGGNLVSLASDGNAEISSGDITVTAGGDIAVEAADISYTLSASALQSSFNGFYLGGFVNITGAGDSGMTVTANSIDARAEDGINIHAGDMITFEAEIDLNHFTSFYTADAAQFQISASNDVFATAEEKVIFQNDEKPGSTTTIDAGGDITFSAGNAYFSGDHFDLHANGQSHFFARDTFSLTSGDITFDADAEVTIKSDGTFDFNSGDLRMNSDGASFTASDAYGGDISFATQDEFTLIAGTFYAEAARSVLTANDFIAFYVGNDFSLTNLESGDINFSAGSNFVHTSTGETQLTSNSFTGSGDSSVSISSHGEGGFYIESSLKQDISFNSGGDLSIDSANDIQFFTDILSFNAVESGVINSNSFSISSTNSISYTSGDYISLTASINITESVNPSSGITSLSATDDLIVEGGSLSYNFEDGVINANGGGARFYSVADTNIFPASNISIESYLLTSFTSFNGSIDILSGGNVHVHGGASRYSSGVNATLEMTANSFVDISSGNNGNVTFYSDFDFIVNAADDFSITGKVGRDSLITSTFNDSDICIRSDFIGDTIFSAGHSMNIQAYGETGFLQAFADNSIDITTSEYSFNILSEGSQTDPQFTLNKTYGILLRTTHEDDNMSGIGVQSLNGSITIFGREGFEAVSRFGDLEQSAAGRVDIRTSFYDADILVQTTKGNITVETTNGYFISGTPSIRADTQVNSTGHQSWSASNFRVQQLSTIQDPSDSAVIFEGYFGDITMDADNSLSFAGNDGGKIDVQSRNGDINFQTLLYTVTADTGAIELEGRTSANFTAGSNIALTAQGTGGTTLLSTPGGNDVVVNSGTTVSFTSTIGEIDFITTTGLTTNSVSDTIFTGPCVNFYGGGSLEIDAVNDIHIQSTGNSIALDAEDEVTVDAAQFSVSGLLVDPLVRITAGGDGTTDGLDVTSDGDVLFTTQNDINLESVAANFISYSNIEFNSFNLNITSSGDSTSQTNIILQASNGDIDVETPLYLEHSHTQTTITSQNNIAITSVNVTGIFALREVRLESETNSIEVDFFTGIAVNQDILATTSNITFTVGDDFLSVSDSIQVLESEYNVDVTADVSIEFLNIARAINFDAANSITFSGKMLTFDSVSYARTELDGYNSVNLNAVDNLDVLGEEIIFTAINNIDYGDNAGNIEITADTFQSTSGSFLSITTENVDFDSYDFQLNAADDISIDVNNFNVETPFDLGQIKFQSGADLTLTAPIQTYAATDNLYLTSVAGIDNYGKDGIYIDMPGLNIITPNTEGVFSLDSRGETEFDIGGQLTLLGAVTYFISSGQSGVQLVGGGLFSQSSTADSDIITDNGSIYLRGTPVNIANACPITLKGDNVYFQTHNVDGHLRVLAANDATFDAPAFVIQPADDPGMHKGFGNITFTSEGSNSIQSVDIELDSNEDLIATSRDTFAITSTGPANLDANRKVELNGAITSLTSPTNINFLTKGVYSDFLIETESLTFASTDPAAGTFTDISLGETRILSGGNTVLSSSTAIDIISADRTLIRADGSFISIQHNSISYTVAGDYIVNADTNDITTTYSTYLYTSDDYSVFAEGSSYLTNVADITTTTLRFESARNFEVIAPSVVVNAPNINLITQGSGDIKAAVMGNIAMTATNTVTFRAEGNLGSLGGAYVIQDDFTNPTKSTAGNYRGLFQNLINENTDAIEAIAVHGSVLLVAPTIDLVSEKGNINFRALRSIQYDAPQTGGTIYFFSRSTFAGANGTYRPMGGNGFSLDYCGGAVVSCTDLSDLINKMISTLIWYGLVQPGNGYGMPANAPSS